MARGTRNTHPNYLGACQFDDWTAFMNQLALLPNGCSAEVACAAVGLPIDLYQSLIRIAVERWRDSTSTSLLHGISYIRINTPPKVGSSIFPDLLWQSRFLITLRSVKPAIALHTVTVRGADRMPVKVRDHWAVTIKPEDASALNDILRCLYVYRFVNAEMTVKLPKAIYRGIRASDLMNHPSFAPLLKAIYGSDVPFYQKRKQAIDVLIAFIVAGRLNEITDGKLLSFSASMSAAKYFARGEGIVLRVDPKIVEVFTSEKHDAALSGPEPSHGRVEREYIVRIPDDYTFTADDVAIEDRDYLFADRNPLCVALFHHDNRRAIYNLEGLAITASYVWRNNTSGGLRFSDASVHAYGLARGQWKTRFGFDPLPVSDNLDRITNFHLYDGDAFFNKWKLVA